MADLSYEDVVRATADGYKKAFEEQSAMRKLWRRMITGFWVEFALVLPLGIVVGYLIKDTSFDPRMWSGRSDIQVVTPKSLDSK